ncbi:hypothetical protein [Microvirga soli]|uniref:hypothetical protein n=1 Tax=Microvirga soli TaxID=1854496 RepID=UPI00191FBC76|nr:hypothetical protein [Microvirga soli]
MEGFVDARSRRLIAGLRRSSESQSRSVQLAVHPIRHKNLAQLTLSAAAGTALSVPGFIYTVGGGLTGGYLGSLYDGTTLLLLAVSFLAIGTATLICVLVAEKVRLFSIGTEHVQAEHHAAH